MKFTDAGRFSFSIIVFILFFAVFFSVASAQESGKKKFGVIHNIAEDRQMERVGGIYEAEGLDKYMKRHFDRLDERLREMEAKLSSMESILLEIRKEMNKERKENILVS